MNLLNTHSSVMQNLASSGGIVPLWLILMGLSVDTVQSLTWVRIASNITACLVSVLICYVTVSFITDKKSGHRWLHSLAFIYFAFRAVMHLWIAFDWLHGGLRVPVVMSILSNSAEVVFGIYYYITRKDLATTYKTSEATRIANIRRLDNVSQQALNLEWMTKNQDRQSGHLTELIANVGSKQ